MPDQFPAMLPYILSATGAGLIGGLVALFWSPRVRMRSAIQHFAAGAVLAAVASNIIPEVERTGTVTGIVAGFVLGGLLMIGLKWFVLRIERGRRGQGRFPAGLAAAAGIDTLLDGAIISLGFSSGQQLGFILTIALALELFFLTLSVGTEFRKGLRNRWRGIVITSAIAGSLMLGALGAYFLFGRASPEFRAILLSFGAAALIYLIAEELLVENIQAEESLFSTAMLFAGFLALVVFKLLNPGG